MRRPKLLPPCVTIIAFVPDVKIAILQLRRAERSGAARRGAMRRRVIIFEAIRDLVPALSMSNSSRPPPLPRASLSRYVYLPFQRLQLTRNCNSCNIIYNGAFPVHRPPVTSYDEQSGDIKHIKICGSERFSTLGARASALTLVKKTAITGVRPNTKSIRGKSRGRVPYSLSTRFATRPRHYFGS